MFCIECGQPMPDEAKFCAYCGTRRAVPAMNQEAVVPPAPPARPETADVAAPPAPARTFRSTAEIMPIRVQRPAPPAMETPVAPQAPQQAESVVPWPTDETATPSLFTTPEPPAARPEQAHPAARAPYQPMPPAEPAAPVRYRSVPFAAEAGAHDAELERRKMSPVLLGAIIVALIAIAGIGWMVRSSMSLGGKTPVHVAITIYPTSAKVAPGKGADFVAEVTGGPAGDVNWSVTEGASAGEIKSRGASAKGDTISLYCTYTAPQKPGTYHLVATSTVDKSKSATAEITVAGK